MRRQWIPGSLSQPLSQRKREPGDEARLRHFEIQARTRMDRLLGARMDGSAATVTF